MIYKICVKLRAMRLMHVHLNVNQLWFFKNEYKVQNQYMKEMLSEAFSRKQTKQNIPIKQKKMI